MLIVNDFFKRKKEAVSNQMELIKIATNGKIIAATRFMNQKKCQKEDKKDNIYIYSPFMYIVLLFFYVFKEKKSIHSFEEEPSIYKRFLFNHSRKNLYVSIYREPNIKFAEHLKKYKFLKRIFVELEEHKSILENYGIPSDLVCVSPTPAKITRKANEKKFNQNHIDFLFASWNNKEGNPLEERGLIYLTDLLVINTNFYLKILLRDNKTKEFKNILELKNIADRVDLLIIEDNELEKTFDSVEFVAFVPQKKIAKDVPNSLIDGLSRGKPVLLSDIFGLAKYVEKYNLGYTVKTGTKPIKLTINQEEYEVMSKNAFSFSKVYTEENYVNNIISNY